jgi:hypothetical protein
MSSDQVARLLNVARLAADETVDFPAMVAMLVKEAVDSGTEPWLLMGVLIEGVAHLIHASVPEQARAECSAAAIQLLRDRIAD